MSVWPGEAWGGWGRAALPRAGQWRRDGSARQLTASPKWCPSPSGKLSPRQPPCCVPCPPPPSPLPGCPPFHLQAMAMLRGCPAKCGQRRVDFPLPSFHLPPWFCVPFVTHNSLFSPLTDEALSPNSKIYFSLSPPPNLPPNYISIAVYSYIAFAIQLLLPVTASQARCLGLGRVVVTACAVPSLAETP